MDERICALSAEGLSVREIARDLGINRGKVHRALMARRAVMAAPAAPVVGADPILSFLTNDDMAWLGVTAADVSAGLGALTRYRVMGLLEGSLAGDAARSLFDHGRGGAAFDDWLFAGADELVPVAGEAMPRGSRDARIVELRRDGWKLRDIADALGMSEGGVSQAISRLATAEQPALRRRGRASASEKW